MSIGEKLLKLRKEKHLSQEEVAERLNVSRQTVSKWETDQSTPDFDKLIPLCNLYEISADELLTGIKKEKEETLEGEESTMKKNEVFKRRAIGISTSVFIYFIATIWIMISIPYLRLDPILSTSIFLFICAIATFVVIYTCMVYKVKKTEEEIKREEKTSLEKQINSILATIVLVIYLYISFTTMAWHVTWILWVVYALIEEIVKLIFMLQGAKDEK